MQVQSLLCDFFRGICLLLLDPRAPLGRVRVQQLQWLAGGGCHELARTVAVLVLLLPRCACFKLYIPPVTHVCTVERFASKTPEERAQLMALVRPYALYGFRYPPFLAPDNHAHLPLPGSPEAYREHSTVTPHGYYPLYREPALCKHTFRHYGRALTLAEPPIGLIAKLLYIALQEHKPIDVDQPIPDDREEAVLLGTRGPTRADYIEFARTKAARYPVHGGSDLAMRHAGASELHDNDWARWRGRFNPWGTPSRDRSAIYTFGSLTGNWAGRSLVSRVAVLRVQVSADADGPRRTRTGMNTRTRRTRASSTQSSRSRTGRMLLRTRYSSRCASTARARKGGRASVLPHWDVQYGDPLDEGIMNAYFPRGWPEGYAAVEMGGTLSIALRRRGRQWMYDTYVAGKEEAKCEGQARVGWSEDVEMEMVDGDGDGDGDEVEERMGRARHTHREVQAVLGENMDVDELIDSVVSDSDEPSSRSSSSDSCMSGCDDHLDIIITGEVRLPLSVLPTRCLHQPLADTNTPRTRVGQLLPVRARAQLGRARRARAHARARPAPPEPVPGAPRAVRVPRVPPGRRESCWVVAACHG